MVTTIQVSHELKACLEKRKSHPKESYEDIIWDLYEDTTELSAQTKKNIVRSRAEALQGKTHSFADVMREAGL